MGQKTPYVFDIQFVRNSTNDGSYPMQPSRNSFGVAANRSTSLFIFFFGLAPTSKSITEKLNSQIAVIRHFDKVGSLVSTNVRNLS